MAKETIKHTEKSHNIKDKGAKKQDTAKEEVVEIETPTPYVSTFQNVINIGILIPLAAIGSLFLLHLILSEKFLEIKHPFVGKVLERIYPTAWDFEGKLKFLINSFIYVSLYLLAHVVITVLSRVALSKPLPHLNEDPAIIKLWNKIIQNTIEQSAIFFPLLASFVLNSTNQTDGKEAGLFVLTFYVSRIIYSFGYLFNHITKFSFIRGGAFILGTLLNVLLIVKFIGCPHFEKVAHDFLFNHSLFH